MMKPWLRLTLITVTVGGGFTGVALTLQALLANHNQSLINCLLLLVFMGIFAFVVVSGLVFVHNPERTGLMVVSLALQVPFVSSPIVAYKMATGFQVFVGVISWRFAGGFRLGSDFQINYFQRLPWGVGINLFALTLLVLLLRATRMPIESPQPIADSVGVPTESATSTPTK